MIEQLFIENYKSIRDAKIELHRLNVLIGFNGVGKSNLFLSSNYCKPCSINVWEAIS